VVRQATAQEVDQAQALENDHGHHRKGQLHVAHTVDKNRLMRVKEVALLKEAQEGETNLVYSNSQHHQNHHVRKYHHQHHSCQHQNRSNRWKSVMWNWHSQ